jgi:hypothetical protein
MDLALTAKQSEAIQKEFARQIQIQYPPLMDFVYANVTASGELKVTPQDIAKEMRDVIYPISQDQEFVLGLNDPGITKQWPKEAADLVRPLRIYDDKTLVGHACPVGERQVVVKWSEFREKSEIQVRHGQGLTTATFVVGDKKWDLALYELGQEVSLEAVTFGESEVMAGDALVAPMAQSFLQWGIACDQAREIKKNRSIGPVYDKSMISTRRSPYAKAIAHALPLFAVDAGRPIYDLKGELVGIHTARFCRTFGLIMPAGELNKLLVSWRSQQGTKDD